MTSRSEKPQGIELYYQWSVTSDPYNPSLNQFSTLTSESIKINKELLEMGTVYVTLTVRNNLAETDSVSKAVEIKSAFGIVFNIDKTVPFEIQRQGSYYISAGFTSSCTQIISPRFEWSLVSISNNQAEFDKEAFWKNQLVEEALYILAYSLPALSELEFEVKATSGSSEGRERISVRVLPSSPSIVLDRVNGYIGVEQTLEIDASDSYDPDSLPLEFQWTCLSNQEDCTHLISNTTSPLCRVEPFKMQATKNYIFTLTLYKPLTGSSVTESVTITALGVEVPQVKFSKQNIYNNIANPQRTVRITAIYEGDHQVSWAVKEGLNIEFDSPLNSPTLAIKQGSLSSEDQYFLSLQIESFTYGVEFSVNKPPQAGQFSVTPREGTELSTTFEFRASNWIDPENHIPLTYSFGVNSTLGLMHLNTKNFSSYFYSELPYLGNQVEAYLEVYDYYETKSTTTLPIRVLEAENPDKEALKSKLTKGFVLETPKYLNLFILSTLDRSNFTQTDFSFCVDSINNYLDSLPYTDTQIAKTSFQILKLVSRAQLNSTEATNLLHQTTQKLITKLDPSTITEEVLEEFTELAQNTLEGEESIDKVQAVQASITLMNTKVLSAMGQNEEKHIVKKGLEVLMTSKNKQDLDNSNFTFSGGYLELPSDFSSYLSGSQYGVSIAQIPFKQENTSSVLSIDFAKDSQAIPLHTSNSTLVIPVAEPAPNQVLQCEYLNSSNIWDTFGCSLKAQTQSQAVCECNHFSVFRAGFSTRKFYASFLVDSDNVGTLSFTEELSSDLSKKQFELSVQDIDFNYKLSKVNTTHYEIKFAFEQIVPEDQPVELLFKELLYSKNQSVLGELKYDSKLSKYKPDIFGWVSVFSLAMLGLNIASSIARMNPSSIWTFLNTIILLSYIPLSSIPISERVSEFLSGFELEIIPIPNIFDYTLDYSYENPHPKALEFGIDTKLFLINTGEILTIFSANLLLIPFAWLLSRCKCKKIHKSFSKLLKNYQYGFFLRFWIQGYLDFCIAAGNDVLFPPESELVPILSYSVSILVAILAFASPFLVALFAKRNSENIRSSEEGSKFYRKWGSLFYEFDYQESEESHYFYVMFLSIRLCYSFNLVVFTGFPLLQCMVNIVMMFGSVAFMGLIRPDQEKVLQVTNFLTEVGVALVFIEVSYFIDGDSDYYYIAENCIIYTTIASIGMQSLGPLLLSLMSLIKRIKKPRHSRKETRENSVVHDSSTIINATENSGENFESRKN